MLKRNLQVAAIVLGIFFGLTCVQPRRAEALVGLASGNVAAAIAGGVMLGAGALTIGVATPVVMRNCFNPRHCAAAKLPGIAGSGVLLLGLVLLDESSGGLPQFQALTSEQQAALDVTADEYAVYESELEEIGAAIDSGAAEAVRAEVQSAEQAKSFFDAGYANLSPETRSVMSKIVQANQVL